MTQKKNDQFFIIAHRGAKAYEPENTLRSFSKAIEMNAHMVEFDVRKTRDNQLVVIHDKTVNRTTNGKGKVKDFTLKEIQQLDAGKGEVIPTLDETLRLLKDSANIVIEIKEQNTEEEIIELIKKYNVLDNVFLVSFHKMILRKLSYIEPGIKTALITLYPLNIIKLSSDVKASAVGVLHYFINKNLIRKCHENNLYIFAWTVNDIEKCNNLISMGVDGVITDKPDII